MTLDLAVVVLLANCGFVKACCVKKLGGVETFIVFLFPHPCLLFSAPSIFL